MVTVENLLPTLRLWLQVNSIHHVVNVSFWLIRDLLDVGRQLNANNLVRNPAVQPSGPQILVPVDQNCEQMQHLFEVKNYFWLFS